VTRVASFLLVFLCSYAQAEPGILYLRGGQIIEADLLTPNEQQLVAVVDGERYEYGWHLVAEVRGQASAGVREHLILAERAWRGLSRIERGDFVAAEPLLEKAHEELGSQIGPTSKAVASGLLTCRLARGAQALAVEPFLCVLLNSNSDSSTDILDKNLRLCQSLPPIWPTDSGLSEMSRLIATDNFSAWDTSRRTRQLAELYATAAVYQISGQAPLPAFEPADDGVRFISEIVMSRIGDEQSRQSSRELLVLRSNNPIPDWQRAWIHSAVGLSLIRESDSRSTRLGVVQLLHVPALYHDIQPYLAGVCLSQAAMALDRMSREREAFLLTEEFQRVYRTHDAGQSPEMKQLIRSVNERNASENHSKDDA
jgi:hypothetical protein